MESVPPMNRFLWSYGNTIGSPRKSQFFELRIGVRVGLQWEYDDMKMGEST